MRKILVTSALPYANGPIHLGHLIEYIQTDIWVRAMKSMGHMVHYVCADDAHGTAIMLKAEQNGISAETQIAQVQQEHMQDFASFLIDFDNYHSTHSDENRTLSYDIYEKLVQNGCIFTKDVSQLFDTTKGLFLADRFVKGECPKCGAKDQYGDNCEVCSATYNATDLKNPYSTLSNSTPIVKTSKHYFFNLPKFESFLQDFIKSETLQPSIANKLKEWFASGLMPWDISRDAPYFGFKIPNTPDGEPDKYFYVWLDAPVGYMASFKNLCAKKGLDFDEYWQKDSQTELYHFIGKDIVYFHALFWPAMLNGANYRTPTGIFAHGFLTVNGEKMSKSRGTFIMAKTFANHLNPEHLRYYFASKLSSNVEDINLDLNDFMQKINVDLVGKVVNIASRTSGFISKHFNNTLGDEVEQDLINLATSAADSIKTAYELREFSQLVRHIMRLADKTNEYINDNAPWKIAKTHPNDANLHKICTTALNMFYKIIIFLAPILPRLAADAKAFLNVDDLSFASAKNVLLGHKINAFSPLLVRIEQKNIDAVIVPDKDAKDNATKNQSNKSQDTAMDEHININDFAKVCMKVAHVVNCQKVDGADKLLQFSLDVGEVDENGAPILRNVFSGIAKFYTPEQLQNKKVVCVTNLAPRKMKFGISCGMILSAEKNGVLQVVILDDDMPIGAILA